MQAIFDENAKRRLTDSAMLTAAVQLLMARGVDVADMSECLARYYYIDLDLLQDVVEAELASSRSTTPVPPPSVKAGREPLPQLLKVA